MKIVAKHIFSIVNESRAQQCGCTKAYALQIKKYLGYMIKKNRKKTIEELSEVSNFTLKYMFNSHDNWSLEWCFKTRESEEVNTYNNKDDELCCKQNDHHLYNLLNKTILPY